MPTGAAVEKKIISGNPDVYIYSSSAIALLSGWNVFFCHERGYIWTHSPIALLQLFILMAHYYMSKLIKDSHQPSL